MGKVELAVERKLPMMTLGAEKIGAAYFNFTYGAEDRAGSQLAIDGNLTAGTRLFPLLRTRRFAL
jgi:hypothetical protein